ncbi:MAG: hypothetical protein IIW90_03190, partial [Alistipes sp.]|nr:hypothetical protein [Alistipes sp.]
YMGYEYFNSLYDSFVPSDAEIEAYFTENEAAYAENGVTRDGKTRAMLKNNFFIVLSHLGYNFSTSPP